MPVKLKKEFLAQEFIDQVKAYDPYKDDGYVIHLTIPTVIADPDTGALYDKDNPFPVSVIGGEIVINGDVMVDDVNFNDGYGNPIGSEVGSLNINITNDFLPVTQGSGDFAADGYTTPLAISPSYTTFNFGFTSNSISIVNHSRDDLDSGSNIEYSFDFFTNHIATLYPGQLIVCDNRRRTSIQMRGINDSHPYTLDVWG